MRANDSNVVTRKYSHIGQFVTRKMKGETFSFNLRLIKFYMYHSKFICPVTKLHLRKLHLRKTYALCI